MNALENVLARSTAFLAGETEGNPEHILVAIHKPVGPTSHDIVAQIRRLTGIKKVGHAGTLDPLASGVLVIGVGRQATKLLGQIVATEKEYQAGITLGVSSTTDDEQGEKTLDHLEKPILVSKIEAVLPGFIGEIKQVPPVFSAIKVKGKRAYSLAREGKHVNLEPRIVRVDALDIMNYCFPKLELRVACGKGVYVRSLARDLGQALHTKAYLHSLVRTKVGRFDLSSAMSIKDFAALLNKDVCRLQ